MNEPLLKRARIEIEDGSPARRTRMARVWIARILGCRNPLADQMAATDEEFRRSREAWTGVKLPEGALPHADQEDEEKSQKLKLAGFFALAVELLLAIYASVVYLVFYWLLAAAVGTLVSIALAVQVKGVLSTSFDPELPRRSVRRLTQWVWVSFVVCLLGIGILLIARSNPWAGIAADLMLAVLNLALPILAGSLFILSSVYGRFGRLEREYDRLRQQVIELDPLLVELRQYLPEEEQG